MATLTPDKHNYYYLLEAERVGIHKPILVALYQVHSSPSLIDGAKGLGISPANRLPLDAVDTFAKQVHYAANTISSLTSQLAASGWTGSDFWISEIGRYSDRFIQAVAAGYAPLPTEERAARLENCNAEVLKEAYLKALEIELKDSPLPTNLEYLDRALIEFVKQIPDYYTGLPYQREALLSGVRIWHQLDTPEEAIAALVSDENTASKNFDNSALDIPLKRFIQQIVPSYAKYPYQREALIQIAQLWRQLPSREMAIATLEKNTSSDRGLQIIDPALIAFVQRLPQLYKATGIQRNALTETFRVWRQLDSRASAIAALGINPQTLMATPSENLSGEHLSLFNIAAQLDRELLAFIRRLPAEYEETDWQRQILLRLVQLWRGLGSQEQAIQSLLDDLKLMDKARPNSPEAPPPPVPLIILQRPQNWTTDNIQLFAPIIVNGSFTWAEATNGGIWMPPNQEIVEAIVRIAQLAQRARDRLGRSLLIHSWYRPWQINQAIATSPNSRHPFGDALDFTCEGLLGNQIYWFLDPWWTGGLGRYTKFPNICYIDAQSYRFRWKH